MRWTYLFCCLFVAPGLLAQAGLPAQPGQKTAVHHKGQFVGTLVLIPLPDGRNMKLKEPFSYIDWRGNELDAPAGFVSDGASIPRAAWSIVGGPWDGKYRNAAVIHDEGCESHKYSSKITHRLFYEAMLDSDVNDVQALTMYYAVLVGGPSWNNLGVGGFKRSNPPTPHVVTEEELQAKEKEIADKEAAGHVVTPEEVEREARRVSQN